MVAPSPEAEALVAQNNGLTIVDMLRPYGYFHHLSGGCISFHVPDAIRSFARRDWPAVVAERICWCLSCSPCADCRGAVLPHQRAQAPLLQLSKYVCPQRRGTFICCIFGTIIITQLRSVHFETLFAQDANAYLDKVLTEAATAVSADSAPDVPTDLTKGVGRAPNTALAALSLLIVNTDYAWMQGS